MTARETFQTEWRRQRALMAAFRKGSGILPNAIEFAPGCCVILTYSAINPMNGAYRIGRAGDPIEHLHKGFLMADLCAGRDFSHRARRTCIEHSRACGPIALPR